MALVRGIWASAMLKIASIGAMGSQFSLNTSSTSGLATADRPNITGKITKLPRRDMRRMMSMNFSRSSWALESTGNMTWRRAASMLMETVWESCCPWL